MTFTEKRLLVAVSDLLATYNDELSTTDIDDFNYNLSVLLDGYGMSLDHYHELLLEEVEALVEAGD